MNESQSKSKSVYSQQVEASIAIGSSAFRFATEHHRIEPSAVVAGFLAAAVKEAAIITFASDANAQEARDAIQTLAEMLVAGFQGEYNDLVDQETKEVEKEAAAKKAAELANVAAQSGPAPRPALNEAQAALIASLAGASFCQACGHAHD